MKRKALLSLVCLAAATFAHAGPPFVTDDPEPVEYRHWEINTGAQYEHGSEGTAGTLPYVEVNYGALPNLQLHVLASVAFSAPAGAGRQSGYGDTELGAKYRFIEETDAMPQVAVFPAVELPTGDSARGLGSGHTQVWLQKSFGRLDHVWRGGLLDQSGRGKPQLVVHRLADSKTGDGGSDGRGGSVP